MYFLENKHNTNISQWGFSVKIYLGELLHKSFFILTTMNRILIIKSIMKLIATYVVGDKALID